MNCSFLAFVFAVLLLVLSRLLIMSISTTFLDFSRWRPYAILDFKKFEISTAGLVRRANKRRHAKCCANRSNRCRYILIFGFFRVSDQTVTRVKLRHRTKFRWNRWYCGRDMAILRFFKIAAAAILDFWNFKFLTIATFKKDELRHWAKCCSKSLKPWRRYGNFSIFQYGGRRHLGFSNF